MKHIHSKLTILVAFACAPAALGCAGSLDTDQDFSAGRTALPTQYATPGAGAGKGGAGAASAASAKSAAGVGGWSTAGGAQSAAPALSAGRSASVDPEGDAGSNEGTDAQAAADGGTVATAPAPAPAAGCDFRGLMQMKCGNASCHGAPGSSTGLDLTSASLATRVAGRKGASACGDKLLIDKDQPEASLLYLKVTGSSCGARMPLGGALTASEQACVLSWIEGL